MADNVERGHADEDGRDRTVQLGQGRRGLPPPRRLQLRNHRRRRPVLPSRSGRTGQAFTRRGQVNIKNARHMDDPRPLDELCTCPACADYSRAYLHHVFRSSEIIASMLLTWHNLHYYQELMAGLRAAIAEQRLASFVAEFHALRAEGDVEPL